MCLAPPRKKPGRDRQGTGPTPGAAGAGRSRSVPSRYPVAATAVARGMHAAPQGSDRIAWGEAGVRMCKGAAGGAGLCHVSGEHAGKEAQSEPALRRGCIPAACRRAGCRGRISRPHANPATPWPPCGGSCICYARLRRLRLAGACAELAERRSGPAEAAGGRQARTAPATAGDMSASRLALGRKSN